MPRSKSIKLVLLSATLILITWLVIPQTFQAKLGGALAAPVRINTEAALESNPAEEETYEKIEKPVYFGIFKFITSFIPNKSK